MRALAELGRTNSALEERLLPRECFLRTPAPLSVERVGERQVGDSGSSSGEDRVEEKTSMHVEMEVMTS